MRNTLWYTAPAADWISGLLIGNGRLAGNIFGSGQGERLGLNHELLYSAKYRHRTCNPDSIQHLPKIRELLGRGEYYEASLLALRTQSTSNGEPGIEQRTDAYKPAGELVICPDHVENRDYIRALDLDTAAAQVSYDGVCYQYAADSVLDKILIRISGPLSARVALEFRPDQELELEILQDTACIRALGEYMGGVRFETRVSVFTDGSFDGHHLQVEKEAWLAVDIEVGSEPWDRIARRLDQRHFRPRGTFEEVTGAHTQKYREMMDRLILELDTETETDMPTDRRMAAFRAGGYDLTLLKDYFDFGHYLMYSGTVLGEMPMNLQGKWNHMPSPPWKSDYHRDINLQMNYWPAESMGMGDAHKKMLDFTRSDLSMARDCARIRYNCRGIFMSMTDDRWNRQTVEPSCCNMWPGAAAWMGQHFFRHYEYTGDVAYLRETAYPFMKEVCAFFEDYLTRDDGGILQVIPSQSPENHFMLTVGPLTGGSPSVAISSAMDLSLVWEILTHSVKAAEILQVDPEKAALWREMLRDLQPLKIGSDGRLLEWNEEFAEGMDPGHRHMSHLYGVYPGNFINAVDTPRLFEAAKKSYDYRMAHGSGHTGWSRSWCVNLDARFARPQQAFGHLRALIGTLTSDTLLDLLPAPDWGGPVDIFQIEGNFGGISGMLEMLAGVSGDRIRLLPALPAEMPGGCVRGLRLPGGVKCDLVWKQGKMEKADITLGKSGTVLLEGNYGAEGSLISLRHENGCTFIQGEPGAIITLHPQSENQRAGESI